MARSRRGARTPPSHALAEIDAAAGQDRLLLRLWLAMPNSRAMPEGHEVLWRTIAAGAVRGGIGQG